MASSKGNIAARVTELILPAVIELGYSIWDVEYVKEGADWHLKITIDSPNGIYVEDCEKVSRAIDPILDEADPIEEHYYLDVSSPGIERDIRTPDHYKACVGEKIEVKLYTAMEGMKSFVGVLAEYSDEADTVTVELSGGKSIAVGRKQISRCNIYFDFEKEFVTEETDKKDE
ncbi:MAG: ribosome maturation factor RimP [Clostridia bacterium]|nr:ribosome maturation factor RimP [Clostridia bacterium]